MPPDPIVDPNAVPVVDPNAPAPGTEWRAGLPEDIRAEKTFDAIKGKDWSEAGPLVARQYLESQKYNVGAIKIPKPDAPAEEWAKYHAKLGRPESADKYELKYATLPASMQWEDGMQKAFGQWAYEAGVTPKQAQVMLDGYTRFLWDQDKTSLTTGAKVLEDLKVEWGGAFKRNLALSQRAVKEFGGQDMYDMMEKSGLGNNPFFIKFFARIGHELLEDTLKGEGGELLATDDAKSEIAKIMSDPKHPYFNKMSPERDSAIARMAQLYQLAYPKAI